MNRTDWQGVFLGAKKNSAGTFVWDATGLPVSYTNWLDYQPDNNGGSENCLNMLFNTTGKWNDIGCGVQPYVQDTMCEKILN